MRLLLVEDNINLGQSCKLLFEKEDYAVDWVVNGELALAALATEKFEVVILDLSLPDYDGLDILKEIRNKKLEVAVMLLTARGSLSDRVKGLDFGADDYLTKPFDVAELLARVRMLIRRIHGKKSVLLGFGNITMDVQKHILFVPEGNIDLTAREFSLMRELCLNSDSLISKEDLVQSLSSFDEEISLNAIEQTISRLRKKISGSNVAIQSVRGLGYMLSDREH
ncbi:MAG: response regulator transcription factor [Rhizobiales bacterium]|nr:response regulator transcription factor [Hyphomicrobiales bacterium]NRB13132.1 response regulator transcription factor [Hyphomicrobiales bacterium]